MIIGLVEKWGKMEKKKKCCQLHKYAFKHDIETQDVDNV
jgi:hypothetical protein